jgi:hypothetical protein
MSVPAGIPSPRSNRTRAGFISAADDLAATDILVTVGDENGGTVDDQFTLASHGLITGDYVWLLWKSLLGTVTGRVGTQYRVVWATANIFQLKDAAGVDVVNTADGTAVFLKGTHATSTAMVNTVILPNLVVADGDFNGGNVAFSFSPYATTGYGGLEVLDKLKLLYKAAAGTVKNAAVNATVWAQAVTTTTLVASFTVSLTSGGAATGNDADGLAIFVKTA